MSTALTGSGETSSLHTFGGHRSQRVLQPVRSEGLQARMPEEEAAGRKGLPKCQVYPRLPAERASVVQRSQQGRAAAKQVGTARARLTTLIPS